MNNKDVMEFSSQAGGLDFENYWGEDLESVEITHYIANIFNDKRTSSSYKKTENIKDKSIINKFMSFTYSLGDMGNLDYWIVKIATKNGEVYSSEGGVRCSIRSQDEGKVILGVNGDSKRMYISMRSGTCGAYLLRVE